MGRIIPWIQVEHNQSLTNFYPLSQAKDQETEQEILKVQLIGAAIMVSSQLRMTQFVHYSKLDPFQYLTGLLKLVRRILMAFSFGCVVANQSWILHLA
jgi:hypothetical protein